MTTPRDAIGLSERLREAKRRWVPIMASHPAFADAALLTTLDEAATALDALSARVKELEENITEIPQLLRMANARALRAEQQCDEALERAAKWHDSKVESLKEWAAVSPSKSRAIAAGATINVHRESAAAIRRLAAGTEKEGK